MRLPPALGAATALAIATVASVARWRFLHSSPYPLGIDGFYYAIQLRSLLRDHHLYYRASPMAFWLMLPGAWALGPIAGAKLGAAVGTALAAVPVYAIVSRATGDRLTGLIGAAIVATSAGSFYLATEFVKQGVGLTLALAFVATLGAALDAPAGRGRRTWFGAAAALFVATLLAHLTALGVAVTFAIPPLWVRATRVGSAHRLRSTALIVATMVVLAAVVVLLVPAVRHDMGLAQLFGPASVDFMNGPAFHHEVPLGALAAVILALRVLAHRVRVPRDDLRATEPSAESRALLLGPAVMALMLAVPWFSGRDFDGLVSRLRIMAFVPLAICAPVVIAQLITHARANLQRALQVTIAAMLLVVVPLTYAEPVAWPNPSFVPAAGAIAEHTPPDAVVIVNHRQLAFLVKWAADREARRQPPAVIGARPVFRLASPGVLSPALVRTLEGVEQPLRAHLPRPVRLGPSQPVMILVAEPTWQAVMQSASRVDRAQMQTRTGWR